MIKEKISDTIYHLYVNKYPDTVETKQYRGDYFTFTIVGFNYDDSPFDFSIYDTLNAQIRIEDPRNKTINYTFLPEEIVLGKTDVQQDESDELHAISENALDFDKFYTKAWLDIQGVLNGEIKTFLKIKILIEPDVTR